MINYIDLFCGIGGFHQAITEITKELNCESNCLFAADNDFYASEIYRINYGINCFYDLKDAKTHQYIDECIGVNSVDFLFAGFPCQPFSKAGNQEGFDNEMKGTLFFEIIKIVKKHKPKYLLLENVRNLEKHDKGNTWKVIRSNLIECGYLVDHVIISPNEIESKKIPALRERMFILCYRDDLEIYPEGIFAGKKAKKNITSIYKFGNKNKGLKQNYFDINSISDLEEEKCKTIDMWDDLHTRLVLNQRKIISPIWPQYFDCDLNKLTEPKWKKQIIKRNIEFYKNNKDIYDEWFKIHKEHFKSLSKSSQKFEWNAGKGIDSAWEGIIQFRPSGVRVKKPDFIPTLVAISQIPIIGIEKRYLKPIEMTRLYGFKKMKFGNQTIKETYKQLGNTVSVDVVKYLIQHMINTTINARCLYGKEN